MAYVSLGACSFTGYPSSTLFPFLLWGLLIRAEHSEQRHPIVKGLPGNLV